MRALLMVMIAASAVAAQERTPEAKGADDVLAAFRAQKDLQSLAARDDPDPWLVADVLCLRGEHDAAEAFAKAAPRKSTEMLLAYVASRRDQPQDTAARKAVVAAEEALARQDAKSALAALESTPAGAGDVVSARHAFVCGAALYALRRFKESVQAFSAAADRAARLGWHEHAARAMREVGRSAYGDGNHKLALESWQRQLAIAKSLANRRSMGLALVNIGLVHEMRADYPSALRCCENALRLFQEVGDGGSAAAALWRIGAIHMRRGSYAAARDHFKRGLRLSRELRDKSNESRFLAYLGELHEKIGDYDRALEYGGQALALARERKDPSLEAALLGTIGLVHHRRGEWSKALELHHQALALQQQLDDRWSVAATLGNIGLVHENRGDYLTALEYQQRSLELKRTLEDRRELAITLGNLGIVHQRLGDYPRAQAFQKSALQLFEQIGDRAGVARTLGNIGVVYSRLGNYRKALAHCERALELSQEMKDRAGIGRALSYLGILHQEMGNYAEALGCMERALDIRERARDRAGVARTMGNMGMAYSRLGDYRKALDYHERALDLKRGLGDKGGAARTLGNIGVVRRLQGDLLKARDCHRRAYELKRKLGDLDGAASSLSNLGLVHEGLGDYGQALEHFERALKIRNQLKDRAGIATSLNEIAELHRQRGDLAQALAYGEKSLALAEESASQRIEAHTRWFLALVHLSRGQPRKAVEEARLASEILAGLLRGLADEEGATARGMWASLFDVGVRAGVALDDASEVSFFIERGRAGMLLESLGGRHALQEAAIPGELRETEALARAAESVALARYRRALADGRRAEQKKRRVELDAARDRVRTAIARIERHAKAAANLIYAKTASLAEIRACLQEDEALVEYAFTKDGSVALVVTRGGARTVRLATRAVLEEAATPLLGKSGLSDPKSDPGPALAKLRGLVVEPLELEPRLRRVFLSPQGRLGYVSLGLLLPKREVVYVDSGSIYRLLREESARRGEGVLALGDPDYPTQGARSATLLRGDSTLRPLQGTREEAESVGTRTLLGKEATAAKLRAALADHTRWRAVHLACHGLINAERPRLSALALTPADDGDGRVTVRDVFGMRIPADLVVLSACETGKGKIYEAEGVVGFTRAFMLAGAPRVIVSLWKVDDEATRALMVKFYELWKTHPTATALKKAQEHVASHDKWKHPYYWAAWQLWGLGD